MGGGRGAQRPVWVGSEFKKTGARSARARTRGQNPLVYNNCVQSKYGGGGGAVFSMIKTGGRSKFF
jgi:hypothetical protein